MKRSLCILTLCLGVFVGVTAIGFAQDGASLYKGCIGCHGADGSKLAMGTGAPLKGQSAEDLLGKLQGYKDGSYGMAKKRIMANIVKRFSEEKLTVLAEYIAGL